MNENFEDPCLTGNFHEFKELCDQLLTAGFSTTVP